MNIKKYQYQFKQTITIKTNAQSLLPGRNSKQIYTCLEECLDKLNKDIINEKKNIR